MRQCDLGEFRVRRICHSVWDVKESQLFGREPPVQSTGTHPQRRDCDRCTRRSSRSCLRVDHGGPEPARRPEVRTYSPTQFVRWNVGEIEDVDLREVFLLRIPILKNCPHFLRGRLRESFVTTPRERYRAKSVGDTVAEERACKTFGLVVAQQVKSVGFHCSRVERGQVSRARQELTGAALAPKTADTLGELQEKRPVSPVRRSHPLFSNTPERPVDLDADLFQCLPSASSGAAPGPRGCTKEMLKVCLDDREVLQFLFRIAEDAARVEMQESVGRAFMSTTMTALQKKDGGARGIAT